LLSHTVVNESQQAETFNYDAHTLNSAVIPKNFK